MERDFIRQNGVHITSDITGSLIFKGIYYFISAVICKKNIVFKLVLKKLLLGSIHHHQFSTSFFSFFFKGTLYIQFTSL